MNPYLPKVPMPFVALDFLKVAICGLVLVALQGSLTWLFGLPGFGPEWMVVLAVYVALRSELWVAVLAAFILGFFRDAMCGFMLGLWSMTLVMVIWLFYSFRSRLNFFNPLALVPLIFMVCCGGYLFVMAPIMAILGWPGDRFNPLPAFLISSLMTALTSPPLFAFLDWLTQNRDDRNPWRVAL